MSLNINEKELETKYYLRVYTKLEEFPTKTDYLFEIVSFLQDEGMLNDDFKASQIKKAFSNLIQTKEINEVLDSLVDDGYFDSDNNSPKKYKLVKHEWI